MNRAKRLSVVLLATLTMVIAAFGTVYADDLVVDHESSHGPATVTATDGKLTVACDFHDFVDPDDRYCEFYGTDGTDGVSVEIVQSNELVYDGTQKPVAVSDLPGGITKKSLYYTGTKADGTNYARTSAAPKDAGTYTASLTLNVDGEGEQIITKEFTIEPKPIPLDRFYWQREPGGPYDQFDYTYDKQNHLPYAYVGDRVLVDGDTCTVNVTGEQSKVGSYTATAESVSNKNYKLPAYPGNTQEFSITPIRIRNITWDTSGATAEPIGDDPAYYYTGEPQSPTIASYDGVLDGEDCTVVVREDTIATDVGYHKAVAALTGADKGNYTLGNPPDFKDYYIVKKTVTPVWDEANLIYNAKVQHPEVELAYTDGSEITDEDKAKVEVKVYSDAACETEVTDKTVVGKQYYAKAFLTEEPDDRNFEFALDAQIVKPFIIYAKPVTVTLTSEDPITYDAQYHKPEVEIEGVEDGDDCVPVESLKGKTKITMVTPDGKTNTIDIEDVNVEEEKGVYHASTGKYQAKVENKNTVDPEDADYDVALSGLKGEDARNYVLSKNATCSFAILPLEITLDWFRPAYDEYGDETGEDPVLVDVANGEKLKLVFNGKVQVPTAKIKEELLLTNPETEEPDECEITISAPSDAIEARPRAYKAVDISFSNPDYTRDADGTDYYIIPHPVKLKWDAVEKTYNGEKQPRTVEITNIQKNDRGKDYSAGDGVGVVEVSEITYTPGFHFGTDGEDTDEADSTYEGETGYYTDEGEKETGLAEGTEIAEDRLATDAGTYVMTAAALSDPYNYTLVKIDPESIELDPATIPETDEPWYVDNHHPIYTIHQYEIKTIDWTKTTVTYNASNQKPVVKVNKNDLQGPDTDEEVAVMIHDDQDSEADDFVGKCNANTYDIYVLKNDFFRGIKGDRCMNYFIGEEAQKMQEKFVIKKKPLTVTVNDKTGYYGDDPATYKYSIKYSGLINGEVNTDDNHKNKNIPGKYTDDEGVTKDVVDESGLKYTANYKKWGKPGKYSIKASGLKSDNYAIKYVAGKLKIKDRKLAGDLLSKVKAGNKKGTVSWVRVSGAAKYQVYFSYCDNSGKRYTPKLYKTLASDKSSFTVKNLKKNTYYKFYVVALDKNGNTIKKTEIHHFCTNDVFEEYTNPKTIKASRKKVTIKKGQSFKLKGTVTKVRADKILTNGDHTQKVRFRSAVPKVATVSANGTIRGVSAGWCRVYVMAANGIWQTVEVTVK